MKQNDLVRKKLSSQDEYIEGMASFLYDGQSLVDRPHIQRTSDSSLGDDLGVWHHVHGKSRMQAHYSMPTVVHRLDGSRSRSPVRMQTYRRLPEISARLSRPTSTFKIQKSNNKTQVSKFSGKEISIRIDRSPSPFAQKASLRCQLAALKTIVTSAGHCKANRKSDRCQEVVVPRQGVMVKGNTSELSDASGLYPVSSRLDTSVKANRPATMPYSRKLPTLNDLKGNVDVSRTTINIASRVLKQLPKLKIDRKLAKEVPLSNAVPHDILGSPKITSEKVEASKGSSIVFIKQSSKNISHNYLEIHSVSEQECDAEKVESPVTGSKTGKCETELQDRCQASTKSNKNGASSFSDREIDPNLLSVPRFSELMSRKLTSWKRPSVNPGGKSGDTIGRKDLQTSRELIKSSKRHNLRTLRSGNSINMLHAGSEIPESLRCLTPYNGNEQDMTLIASSHIDVQAIGKILDLPQNTFRQIDDFKYKSVPFCGRKEKSRSPENKEVRKKDAIKSRRSASLAKFTFIGRSKNSKAADYQGSSSGSSSENNFHLNHQARTFKDDTNIKQSSKEGNLQGSHLIDQNRNDHGLSNSMLESDNNSESSQESPNKAWAAKHKRPDLALELDKKMALNGRSNGTEKYETYHKKASRFKNTMNHSKGTNKEVGTSQHAFNRYLSDEAQGNTSYSNPGQTSMKSNTIKFINESDYD